MSDLSQTPFLHGKARPVRAPQGTTLTFANDIARQSAKDNDLNLTMMGA
ncbi:MAG: hypothetical protein ACREXV_05830 [Polaromonas sp.]